MYKIEIFSGYVEESNGTHSSGFDGSMHLSFIPNAEQLQRYALALGAVYDKAFAIITVEETGFRFVIHFEFTCDA